MSGSLEESSPRFFSVCLTFTGCDSVVHVGTTVGVGQWEGDTVAPDADVFLGDIEQPAPGLVRSENDSGSRLCRVGGIAL
jgi:hypothetical protein